MQLAILYSLTVRCEVKPMMSSHMMNAANDRPRVSTLMRKVSCVFLSIALALTLSPFAAFADQGTGSSALPASGTVAVDVQSNEPSDPLVAGSNGSVDEMTGVKPGEATAGASNEPAVEAAGNAAADAASEASDGSSDEASGEASVEAEAIDPEPSSHHASDDAFADTSSQAPSSEVISNPIDSTAGKGASHDPALFSVTSPVVEDELIVVYKGDAAGLDEDLGIFDESQDGALDEPSSIDIMSQEGLSLRDVGVVSQEVIDDVDGNSVDGASIKPRSADSGMGDDDSQSVANEPVDAAEKALSLQSADGATQSAAAESLANQGDVAVVKLSDGVALPDAMEQILSSDRVADVQPNFVYSQLYVPNDPDCNSTKQFYLWKTRTVDAWSRVKANGNVTVAVVDSGICGSHPDLRGNVLEGLAYDAHHRRSMSIDDETNGHGTEVSGIISAHAGNGVGLAGVSYNAKILPVKVFYEVDGRVVSTTSDLVRAYDYLEECLDQKAVNNLRVVNLSLGYPSTGSFANTDRQVQNAIGNLRDRGVLTVAAGGNITASTPENAVVYPSDFDECLSVTSLDKNDKESDFTCVNKFKDLSAPGENVFTTNMYGSYSAGAVDGSSFAAPQVAGAAALLWVANPKLSVDDVCQALKKTASHATLKSGSASAGMLDVESAVDLVTRDDWQKAVEGPTHSKYSMANVTVTLPEKYFYYDGGSIAPEVEVKEGRSHLRRDIDYVVKYRNNVNAGTATVEVEGRGAYVGTKRASFTIMPAEIERAWLNATQWTYRGSAITPSVYVRANVAGVSKTVANGIKASNSNFRITYSGSRVNAGTYVVTITGRGNYTGTASAKFTVSKARLNGLRLSGTSLPYTGSVVHPAVTVTANCGGTTKAVATGVRSSTNNVSVSYSAGSKGLGTYTVTVTGRGNYSGTMRATYKIVKPSPTVQYRAHVQKQGWQPYAINGGLAGTSGKGLRMEALCISLANKPKSSSGKTISGDIQYRTHVQKLGWTGWAKNGALSGTVGRKLRLEAVQIRLTGEMAKRYDVYYSVHCQKAGWTGWAKNGAMAGTQGYGYRMEAVKVKLVPKGGPVPGKVTNTFHQKNAPVSKTSPTVQYASHVQKAGWQFDVANGAVSGTVGKRLREEALRIKLYNKPKSSSGKTISGDIQYRTHVQKLGWTGWAKNGALSGTVGRKLRLEAVQIRLTGEMAKRYDVYYSVHCQKFGWTGWAKNGAKAGSQGYGYRMEAVKVKLVPKGGAAPGKVTSTFHLKR